MSSLAEAFLFAIVGFLFGTFITVVIINDSWSKDCEKAGKHRMENTVFVCHKEAA